MGRHYALSSFAGSTGQIFPNYLLVKEYDFSRIKDPELFASMVYTSAEEGTYELYNRVEISMVYTQTRGAEETKPRCMTDFYHRA